MTDFIHEHPKKEEPVSNDAQKPHEEEEIIDERLGQKRVYVYIMILFVVAFFLLLWSFLMNQRSNEEVLTELRGSTSTLQSTLDKSNTLEDRVRQLEDSIDVLESRAQELEAENSALIAAAEESNLRIELYRKLALLEALYADGEILTCRELLEEITPLLSYLESGEGDGDMAPLPERLEEIRADVEAQAQAQE